MIEETYLEQFGALTGLLASTLLFIGSIVNDVEVSATSSSSTIARVLTQSQTTILVGTYMTMLGVFFFLWFLAYVRYFLLESLENEHWLISAGFGGGLVAAAMLLVAAHFSQAFTILSSYGSETQVAKALYLLDWNWYLLVEAPALAAMIGAISAVGFTHNVLPRWLSWWGALLTVVLLAPFVTGSGIMLAYLWLAALSILLLFEKRQAVAVDK